MPGETPRNPLYMKVITQDLSARKILAITLVAALPVAITMLMQNSALRQRLAMQFWRNAETTSGKLAGMFEIAKRRSHDFYEISRL